MIERYKAGWVLRTFTLSCFFIHAQAKKEGWFYRGPATLEAYTRAVLEGGFMATKKATAAKKTAAKKTSVTTTAGAFGEAIAEAITEAPATLDKATAANLSANEKRQAEMFKAAKEAEKMVEATS